MIPDIVIDILYDMKTPERTVVKTNAKSEALDEIISTWLQLQAGQGEDVRQANDRDIYNIRIGLSLQGDVFSTSSDTGNDGLTCGIVMDVWQRLDSLKIGSLSYHVGVEE
jgi:hypothetical protein